jgi:ABC-type branched-subunit amino acid transport system substrate-binding protein
MSASVRLLTHEVADDLGALPPGDGLSAIVGGHDAASVMSLAAGSRGAIALLNISATDDGLRGSLCGAAVFHVAPSETMLSRALSETKAIQGARVAAWHPSLDRYGAEQLNDRYRARFSGTPGMSGDAWSGWVAMKILAESALRSRAETNADLIAWLSSSRARFDGHKGRALTFDASGQLRQPLYVITPGGAVSSEVVPMETRGDCR